MPALKHSDKILSKIEILPRGHISFGKDFVSGNNLVPKPASGIIA